ncbi:MAG: Gfo/Idh/MocA family oxidoreductase [Saprospiraceae bacterium]|nr:Gfo/Idh/MocA family oxidoreductase [Saprospiraceae bacterium]
MSSKLRVLVVGCGHMGISHARAYHQMEDFEIVGLVSRKPESRNRLSDELGGLPTYDSFEKALTAAKPDVVSINTYPETHYPYCKMSLESGAHVFTEKPLALTVDQAQELVDLAIAKKRKMVIGYILRVHPAWTKFIEKAKTLGKPLVMRMNLNQQSSGAMWSTHKSLMASMSPIVDCGVHYVDVMCLMTGAKPVRVSAIGARLSDEIDEQMYNYGQLQVSFDDGSIGWYEAGWGPMMSETAFFVKDVVGPKGSVSIVDESGERSDDSSDIEGHTKTGGIKLHHAELDENKEFARKDEFFSTKDEPTHDELCYLEQEYLLNAIKNDVDLTDHLNDAVNSLRIVLAADESFKTGKTVTI